MKLLIITQKVDKNDSVLGFFIDWIKEFSENCEKVTVICLWKGDYDLPDNIRVLSLGKEVLYKKKFLRLKIFVNFFKLIFQERKNYDSVFVHMNQIYVILGGFIWRLWNKRIGLWYAHGHASFSVKVASKITDTIFTSTPQGCRINSKKIKIVGQGIDLKRIESIDKVKNEDGIFRMVAIGRTSPVKSYETLIDAIEIVIRDQQNINLQLDIVGGPSTEKDKEYFKMLECLVNEKNLNKYIIMHGGVPNAAIKFLPQADLFVHTGNTGSLDKTVLEAMAFKLPVISCNDAVKEELSDYKGLHYKLNDEKDFADKILYIINMAVDEKAELVKSLSGMVKERHGLDNLIKKIINYYK